MELNEHNNEISHTQQKPKVKVIFTFPNNPQTSSDQSITPTTNNNNNSNYNAADESTSIKQTESIRLEPDERSELDPNELLLFPEYAELAFGRFKQSAVIRYWLLRLLTWSYFEKMSMFVIVVNCITMGMFNPCAGHDCRSMKCVWLEYIDHVIYFFFFIEMLIKIVAMGFFGKKGYWAETWNRLDCFIVCAG